jgi:hypothetical protein
MPVVQSISVSKGKSLSKNARHFPNSDGLMALDLEVLQEAFIYFLHGVRPSDPVFPLRLG